MKRPREDDEPISSTEDESTLTKEAKSADATATESTPAIDIKSDVAPEAPDPQSRVQDNESVEHNTNLVSESVNQPVQAPSLQLMTALSTPPAQQPVPVISHPSPPIVSHTRVKCQECGSLISVSRRSGDNIKLFKCPVCCAHVAFDHRHSPTIIPYQERTDNFSCHTWNPNQLMVFIQQMGLPQLLPYLAHHNIDGREMMELFRGELRQRVGLQTEEQTQALLGALNILRLGEGIG